MSAEYRFYGSWPSYYTAKGRAYMQYKRLPYTNEGASMVEYATVIMPRTGKMFIPVVMTPNDEPLQDTCDIIDELERRHPERPVVPADPLLRFASKLMEYYADECLIYPGLHMRWHYGDENTEWAMSEFERVATTRGSDVVPPLRGFSKKIQMYAAALGMTDDASKAAVRRVFDRLMAKLDAHFRRHQFLLGATPSLGDIALMGPIFGHFYRDPYSAQILRREYPRVCTWAEDMNLSNAVPADRGWELSESSLEVFKEIGAAFGQFIPDLSRALDRTITAMPSGAVLERIFDQQFDTKIMDTPIHLGAINSHWAYKLQRVRDAYQEASATDRGRIDSFLKDIGCTGSFERTTSWRVSKNAEGWLVR